MRFLIKWEVEVIGKISSLCIISAKMPRSYSLWSKGFHTEEDIDSMVADEKEYILKIFPIV